MEKTSDPFTDFSEELWGLFVEKMAVRTKGDIRMTFKDGTEVALRD